MFEAVKSIASMWFLRAKIAIYFASYNLGVILLSSSTRFSALNYFILMLKRCFTSQSENHSLLLLRAMQLFFPFLLQNFMPFIAFIMISRQNNHHIFLSKKTFFHANFDALQTRHFLAKDSTKNKSWMAGPSLGGEMH